MTNESTPSFEAPPGGVNRTDLLAAALRVLRDEGPSALRVRRVAAEAGCSTMGVYTWFGGKEGLVEAMWVDGFRRLQSALLDASAGGQPLRRLAHLGVVYRDWALAHSTEYELMFGRAVPEFEPSLGAKAEAAPAFAAINEPGVSGDGKPRQARNSVASSGSRSGGPVIQDLRCPLPFSGVCC